MKQPLDSSTFDSDDSRPAPASVSPESGRPGRITPGRCAALAAGMAVAVGLIMAAVTWAAVRNALETRARQELDRVSQRLRDLEAETREALADLIGGEAAADAGPALMRALRRRAGSREGLSLPPPLEFLQVSGSEGPPVLLSSVPWGPEVLERWMERPRGTPGARWRVADGPSGPVVVLFLHTRAAGVEWAAGRRVFPESEIGPEEPGVAVEWWTPPAAGVGGAGGFLLNRTAPPQDPPSRIGLAVTQTMPAAAEDGRSPVIRIRVWPRALWDDPASWAAAAGVLWLTGALLASGIAYVWARRGLAPWYELWRALNDVASGRADFGHAAAGRNAAMRLPAAFSTLQRCLDEQQRRRLEAERAAAWREAARVIAHEIRNALSPLRLGVQNLQKAGARNPDLYAAVLADSGEAMLEEVGRLERLAATFRDFATLPSPRPERVNLAGWVRSMAGMWAPDDVRVECSHEPDFRIYADPDLLARAVQNCIVNARQVSGGKPVVLVLEGDGTSVRLRVEDQGPGFDAETRKHAFRAGYTRRGGEGLGLALVYRIVREHGGRVRLSNRPCGGGAVEIELPAEPDETGPPAETGG